LPYNGDSLEIVSLEKWLLFSKKPEKKN
jgi:hypothetical protein